MGRAYEKKKVGKTSSGNNWIYLQERWKLISEVNLGTQTLLLKSTDSSSLGPLSNSKQNESHHPRLHFMSVSFTLALIPAWLCYITHIISFQGSKHRDRSYPKPAVPPPPPHPPRWGQLTTRVRLQPGAKWVSLLLRDILSPQTVSSSSGLPSSIQTGDNHQGDYAYFLPEFLLYWSPTWGHHSLYLLLF